MFFFHFLKLEYLRLVACKSDYYWSTPKLGPHAHAFAKAEDSMRVDKANRRSLENTQEARVARQQQKLAASAANKAEEGMSYGPGIDYSM